MEICMKLKKLESILAGLCMSLMLIPFFTSCNGKPVEKPTEKVVEGTYYAYGYEVDFSTGELCSVYNEHEYIQLYKDGTIEYWFGYYDGYYTGITLHGYTGTYVISNNEITMTFEYISSITGEEEFATGNVSNGVLSFYWNGERNEPLQYEPPLYFCKEGSKPQDKSVEVVFKANGETLQTHTYSSKEHAVSVPNVPSKEGLVGEWELKEGVYEEVDKYKITIEAVYTSIGTAKEDWLITYLEEDEQLYIYGLQYIGKEQIVEVPMVLCNVEIKKMPSIWIHTVQDVTGIVIPKSITEIDSSAFERFQPSTVYYKGTKTEWDLITKNGNIEKVTTYYYSETQPHENGNYWYYDENGSVTVW